MNSASTSKGCEGPTRVTTHFEDDGDLEQTIRLLAAFEGGSVHVAERGGEFLVIIEQTALLDLLDPDERADTEAVKVLAFPSESARREYIAGRGWPTSSLKQ